MSAEGEWQRLCALLDDDRAVSDAVRAALAGAADPWQALLDGLDDAGALAYLRVDDTGMELTDALAQLPRVVAEQPDLDAATDEDDLPAAVRLSDRALAGGGLRIVRLVDPEDEQALPLVVVPAGSVVEIVRTAESLGGRAVAD